MTTANPVNVETKSPSWGDRLKSAVLKPADPGVGQPHPGTSQQGPATVAELEISAKQADDKERTVGYLAAPLAAAIAFLTTASLIAKDPPRLLHDGRINPLHVSTSLYLAVGGVAIALAVLMLVLAWQRKRLYLGIVMALYGLSTFNLHFWGFGLPFIMAGAWLIVRAYRLNSSLKEATAADITVTSAPSRSRSAPNKRYTPPTRRPTSRSRSAPKAS